LCWYVFGYAFAFGAPAEDANRFMGYKNMFMTEFWASKSMFRFWVFQGAFCATGATIVSGAMAERTQLKGFSIYTAVLTSLVYPVVVYWGWSGSGVLWYTDDAGEDVSVVGPSLIDFAGSGIVHMVGGVGALCGAIIVGPRKDRFDETKAHEFEAHSIPFCVIGTFFLWFGWYGFNAGSTGSMHDKATANTAGLVAVNTTMAPCAAGLVVFILRRFVLEPKLLDVGGFCNGILGGLVSITAGCAVMEPWESVVIGIFGGIFYQLGSMLLKRLKVDDVVDAFPVHGVCGLWGIIACGCFGNPDEGNGGNGLFYFRDGAGKQLGTQLFAAFIIVLWVGVLSVLVFLPLRILSALRLTDDFQDKGADIMEHSPSKAYSADAKVNGAKSGTEV